MFVIARVIRLATGVAVALIVAGILLWVLSANQHNALVSDIHDAGRWLVGPFHNVFKVKGAKLELGLNWGLAALIYAVASSFLASLVGRATIGRRGWGRRAVA